MAPAAHGAGSTDRFMADTCIESINTHSLQVESRSLRVPTVNLVVLERTWH